MDFLLTCFMSHLDDVVSQIMALGLNNCPLELGAVIINISRDSPINMVTTT